MKSLKDTIEFKGTKDGFIIVINNEADYEEARKNLIDKINSNLFFFKGSQFCDIYATNLNEKEKLDLINFLKEKYNINFSKKEKANYHASRKNGIKCGICGRKTVRTPPMQR